MFSGRISNILAAWMILLTFGAVMVASAAVALTNSYFSKHLVYVSLALVGFVIAYAIPTGLWVRTYLLGWAVAALVAILVLIPGLGHEVNGASRWLRIGNISLQAAEVAKLGLGIYLAGYLARHGERLRDDARTLLVPLTMVALVAGMLVLEPDLGSAVVLITATVTLTFIAGAKLRYFLLIGVLGAAVLGLLILDEPYRLQRLIAFVDPWAVQYGSGYQLTQALIAFGRGELFGLGLGEGVQKLFYLPEAHTDFIFAVIAEELGVLGAVVAAAVLAYLVVQLLVLAQSSLSTGQRFAGYLTYFLGLVIGIQFLVSLGVNTGVLPTKGLTLPFISYGGNSLIVLCALLGIALRACAEEKASTRGRKRG